MTAKIGGGGRLLQMCDDIEGLRNVMSLVKMMHDIIILKVWRSFYILITTKKPPHIHYSLCISSFIVRYFFVNICVLCLYGNEGFTFLLS